MITNIPIVSPDRAEVKRNFPVRQSESKLLSDAAAALGVAVSTLQDWPEDVLRARLLEGLAIAEGRREVADRHADALIVLLTRTRRAPEVSV